jgi:hypothetical protein
MTTVLTPYDLGHLVQVVTDRHAGCRAECSCGWASPWTDDHSAAGALAAEHSEVAVGPPTGLDAAIGGLLDLQDDLADAVMWLAENWSATLPTPSTMCWTDHTGHGPAVPVLELLVQCESDQLTWVAGLLGAPVVRDAAADSFGHRYERAVRRFGRVHLTAFRQIPAEPSP